MGWADAALIVAVLALAAMTGWCIALVIQRRRHVCPVAQPPAPPPAPVVQPAAVVPEPLRIVPSAPPPPPEPSFAPSGLAREAVLMSASGAIESVRQMPRPGLPPAVMYRSHGKKKAGRYHLIGQDGERALYRAES